VDSVWVTCPGVAEEGEEAECESEGVVPMTSFEVTYNKHENP